MTRDEIMKLEAGRELDALIAEKVMGNDPLISWAIYNKDKTAYYDVLERRQDASDQLAKSRSLRDHGATVDMLKTYKPYSTDIADAWQVVEYLEKRDILIDIVRISDRDSLYWLVRLRLIGYNTAYVARAETAPLAICKAALMVVTMEETK